MRLLSNMLMIITAIICIAIVYFGLNIYFKNFSGNYSSEQSVWGAFGDYVNMLINVINLIILLWIGVITFRTTNRYNIIQLRPQLYLSTEQNSIRQQDDSWYIRNAYEAPAINILVRFTMDRNANVYTTWVTCFSLSKDLFIEMDWLRFPDVIEIAWGDITNTNFFQTDFRDWNGTTRQINRSEYEVAFLEARNNNQNTNNLLNRDFRNVFFAVGGMPFSQANYLIFLQNNNLM